MEDKPDNPYEAPREVSAPSESLAQAKRVDKWALRMSLVSLLSAVAGAGVLAKELASVGFLFQVDWLSAFAILMCIAVGTGIWGVFAGIRARHTLPPAIGVIGFLIGASGISLLMQVL